MTARYRMERNPDSGKNGNKMPLHPRLIPYETVSIKKLMKYAKSRSTYSEADIAGALQLITDLVTERLREGDNVEIEGLGFFSVSLQSRAVMSKTELRSESVRFKNVNFRCCQQLKKALKTLQDVPLLFRMTVGFSIVSVLTFLLLKEIQMCSILKVHIRSMKRINRSD